jgi:hypothetical protein
MPTHRVSRGVMWLCLLVMTGFAACLMSCSHSKCVQGGSGDGWGSVGWGLYEVCPKYGWACDKGYHHAGDCGPSNPGCKYREGANDCVPDRH